MAKPYHNGVSLAPLWRQKMKEILSINFSSYQVVGGCINVTLNLDMIGIAFEGLDKLLHRVDHRHDDIIIFLLQVPAVSVQLPSVSLHTRETMDS